MFIADKNSLQENICERPILPQRHKAYSLQTKTSFNILLILYLLVIISDVIIILDKCFMFVGK